MRIDILTTSADPFSVAAGDVLMTLYQTAAGDPLVEGYKTITQDISAFLRPMTARNADALPKPTTSVLQMGVDWCCHSVDGGT